MKNTTTIPLLACLSLLACACADGGGADGYSCVRDPVAIAEQTACSRDEQCPCGTHCHNGLCIHECLADDDCQGHCDFFGHCLPSEEATPLQRLAGEKVGVLQVTPVHIAWYDPAREAAVFLRAGPRALSGVRVAAGEGLLVACQDTFGSACTIPVLAAGGELRLRVKADGDFQQRGMLQIYHHDQLHAVVIEREDPPAGGAPPAGTYAGQIWIDAAGVVLSGEEPYSRVPLQAQGRMLKIPLELGIFEDGTLVFSDPSGILPQQWVFQLDEQGHFDAHDGREDLSRLVYIGGAADTDDQTATEVGASAGGRLLGVGDQITGTLEVILDGLGLDYAPPLSVDERLSVTFRFSAMRTGDIPAGTSPPALGGGMPPIFSLHADRHDHRLPWAAEVDACGRLDWTDGAGAAEKTEYYLCYQHEGMTSVPLTGDNTRLTGVGDLQCAGGDPARSTVRLMTDPGQARQALSACIEDLEHLALEPLATTDLDKISCGAAGCSAETLPRCVDGPVFLRALGLSLESIERRGLPDTVYWQEQADGDARLAHRLVQQWIQLHTFTAREAAQVNDLVLAVLDPDAPGLDRALALSLNAWDLVLHPAVFGRLMHLPGGVLREPDYRGEGDFPAPGPDCTQAIGVPVVMLEGLRAQIEAATRLIRQARFDDGAPDPRPLIARTLRYAVVLVPAARLLHARAAVPEAPDWEGTWQDAVTGLDHALKDNMTELRAYAAGSNPLGITDADLPLYRSTEDLSSDRARFSAVTGYLVGRAQGAVQNAAEDFESLQDAWEALLDRQLQAEIQDQERQDRIDAIKQNYGEKIVSLCGNPDDLPDREVLTGWADLSPASCFMNNRKAGCVFDEQELLDKLNLDDIGYHLCLLAEINVRLGGRAELQDQWLNQKLHEIIDKIEDFYDMGGGQIWDRSLLGLDRLARDVFGMVTGQGIGPIVDFRGLEVSSSADEQAIRSAEQLCRNQYPGGTPLHQKIANLESSPLDRPECYQGTIGELALAARAAAKEIDVANSELQDHMDSYKKSMHKCVLANQALALQDEVSGRMQDIMDWADDYTTIYNKEFDLINGLVSGIGIDLGSDGVGLGLDLGPMSETVTGIFKDALGGFVGADKLKELHAGFIKDFEHKMNQAVCFNEAEMHLVGVDTQALRIEKSKLDLSQALLRMRNAQQELAHLIHEGRGRVAAEENRQRTSLFHDIWDDLWALGHNQFKGAIEAFRKSMRRAQRNVYLVVRAVEYEWQMTHSSRAQVLAARTPAELQDVLDDISNSIDTNQIEDQSPEGLHVVLSLKKELLQLHGREDWSRGQHTMDQTQRFRALLASPHNAVYADDGTYLGQRIPFTIAPLGVLGLGDAGSIRLLTGADCAERIWQVNAVLAGDGLVHDESTYKVVQLQHKNTFYSQWCVPPAENDLLQRASVRPAHNLFKDPVWGASGAGESSGEGGTSDYVTARIEAYFNVSRQDFEAEAYVQGGTDELACRGLYGDYALFFPAEQLDLDGTGGLRLEHLDDILLRIDYVSVAKPGP